MIDPFNIGWTTPDQDTVQEFMLFCTFVKNKPAAQISKKLDAFLYEAATLVDAPSPPLHMLGLIDPDYIEELLHKHKLSPYKQNLETLNFLMWDHELWQGGQINPNLARSFYRRIPGWSYKTASFFKLYIDPM